MEKSYKDNDEEEDICRICRSPEELDNPLRYPCACSGTIKYVHQECLGLWLNHSKSSKCEICKHAFSFSPVYAENAPTRLPFQEFIDGMVTKACRFLKFLFRLSFVLSVWLLIVPFITFWIWRLAFVRSLGEAQRLVLSHDSFIAILTDCLQGYLISANIVILFRGDTSLRNHFRHLREIGGQDVARDDDGGRNGAPAARRPPMQANRMEVNVDDVAGAQGILGAGQIIRRNAENVAARWELQAARLEAHVEQIFDGIDNADDAEDLPFVELIGMHGPFFRLYESVFTVLAANMIFHGVVIFVPFSLARVILHYVSAANPVLSTMISLPYSALSLANFTLKNTLTSVVNLSSDCQNNLDKFTKMINASSTGFHELNNLTSSFASDSMKVMPVGTSSRLSDGTTLAVGYMFIFFLLFLYLGTVALIRYVKGESLTTGRFYCIASIAETIPSIFQQFMEAMRHLITITKVSFLLVIELVVFPLMCGWWIHICTKRMFDKSMSQRVEFFSFSLATFVHWTIGILFFLQISIFLGLLREVLRIGVLFFLIDPADPTYNPFRHFIGNPMHKHAKRVLVTVGVYGSLIVMLVFVPVQLAMRIAPMLFPLNISLFDPLTEIPADMLLFQIIPFAVKHYKLLTTVKSVLRYWLTAVCWVFDLTDYLLPGSKENGNAKPVRQNIQRNGQGPILERLLNTDNNSGRSVSSNDTHADEQSKAEYNFALRIVLLLVVAWITLVMLNSILIVVPISLGRTLVNLIPLLRITHGIKCNDIYAFIIGSFVILTGIVGIRYCADHFRTRRVRVLLRQVQKWSCIVLKTSALLSIWIFIIPILIGLLFELTVVVPIRVPVNENPVFHLDHDWVLGIGFLKIWTKLVMLDCMASFVDQSWRVKFERVRARGFSGLQGCWVLQKIVFPVLIKLLTALCIPYVLARGVFPIFGYPTMINSVVYRFAWLGCLCLSLVCFCAKMFFVWLTNLHNSIRDERYLIGHRLLNFGELSRDIIRWKWYNVGLRFRR